MSLNNWADLPVVAICLGLETRSVFKVLLGDFLVTILLSVGTLVTLLVSLSVNIMHTGLSIVDVLHGASDTNGFFQKRVVSRGASTAPDGADSSLVLLTLADPLNRASDLPQVTNL